MTKTLKDVYPAAAVEEGEISRRGPVIGPVPVKYTIGLHQVICYNIRKGNRPVTAAAMAGITSNLFHDWMRKGKAGDVHLWQFAQDVELAMGQAEGTALSIVRNDPGMEAENAKWWLERARSGAYSKEVHAKVEAELEEFMQRLESALPAAVFEQVLAAFTGQLPNKQVTYQLTNAPPEED